MTVSSRDKARSSRGARAIKFIAALVGILLLLLIMAAAALYFTIRASVADLDGERILAGLSSAVKVNRDANGTAVIQAQSMNDAMRALGFVHAQERFFEMDLTRRSAAGELSALLGAITLDTDKKKRVYHFRHRLEDQWRRTPPEQQAMFTAYANGVNAGLNALPVRPWQYLALRTEPQPWREVDSLLIIAEMFYMLQESSIDDGLVESQMRTLVRDEVYQWLKPLGGSWDAPLDGSAVASVPMPTPEQLNTRVKQERREFDVMPDLDSAADDDDDSDSIKGNTKSSAKDSVKNKADVKGSNNWAVGGALTKTGSGIFVNDMHLGLGVPCIWFRAQIEIATPEKIRIVGVTLPGLPAMVAGSNGHVAWGYTNSYGQWHDWARVPPETPTTPVAHRIEIKGGDAVTLMVEETAIGPIAPVIPAKARMKNAKNETVDMRYAFTWVALWPDGINADVAHVMTARSVDEAVAAAHRAGMPHQNFVVVDKNGNMGWTLAGKMPTRQWKKLERGGFASYAAIAERYGKWLPDAQYPKIINPSQHRLWTANSRPAGGEMALLIGNGGFDNGARAQQIRDRLFEREQFDEKSAIAVQYDNEARFLQHWKPLLEIELVDLAKSGTPGAQDALTHLQKWNGRADVDQVGYFLLREFRHHVIKTLWGAWLNSAIPEMTDADGRETQLEYPVWDALIVRPIHLLPLPYETWDAFITSEAKTALSTLIEKHGSINNATWGAHNVSRIRHPFSRILPALSPYLDMPTTPRAGDAFMPAVAGPAFGSSQRLAVSPGFEENGILTMPGGQSGHPLSPFYGAGHDDWLTHKNAPLLAGDIKHVLVLRAN